MKRIWESTLAIVCGAILSVSAVACGRSSSGGGGPAIENLDTSRTQIYVLNYNGGIGDEWLRTLKGRFETEYADWVGDDGKVGVQVYIDNTKTNCTHEAIAEALKTSRDHVWFTEQVPYYTIYKKGGFYDIYSKILFSERGLLL